MTALEPLTLQRANELANLLRHASSPDQALVLDARGVVQGVVKTTTTSAQDHVVGDLDVHA